MKRTSAFLLFTAVCMIAVAGVSYEAATNKTVAVELSKIEKSYTVTSITNAYVAGIEPFAFVGLELIQPDVYSVEETAYGDYVLPTFEAVYIEPASPVPLTA